MCRDGPPGSILINPNIRISPTAFAPVRECVARAGLDDCPVAENTDFHILGGEVGDCDGLSGLREEPFAIHNRSVRIATAKVRFKDLVKTLDVGELRRPDIVLIAASEERFSLCVVHRFSHRDKMDGRIAKGDATRSLIVEKATVAFAQAGYAATSVEDILAATGVSRGALYHHFDGKEALFTAVLEAVEERVAKTVVSASEDISDPLKALHAGCEAWVNLGNDPVVKQIVLIDAPAVLGWERWRELDRRFGFGLLRASIQNIARAGYIRKQSADIFAHMLLAALLEVALLVARDDKPPTALRNGRRAVQELIDKLVAVPKEQATRSGPQLNRTRRKS